MVPPGGSNEPAGLSSEISRRVVAAIEQSIPLYDHVNNLISFGRAQTARKFAIEALQLEKPKLVLDAGIGPVTTSKLLLDLCDPDQLVGLDASPMQLKTAQRNLTPFGQASLHLVRGTFEFLPFRDNVFDAIITCYALRDSVDIRKSLGEYQRICGQLGVFADVDLAKPDNVVKRAGSIFYVRYVMPLIAKLAIVGKMKGNPWRMIVPTYKALPTTNALLSMLRGAFVSVECREFLMGGIVAIVSRRPTSRHQRSKH